MNNWLWILTLITELTWSSFFFLEIWWWPSDLSGKAGVFLKCCYEAVWIFLEASSFDCPPATFPTATWNPNILENSCVAPTIGRNLCLFPRKEVWNFQLPRLLKQSALPPLGVSSALGKGIGHFKDILIGCASLSKGHMNTLDLFLFIREKQNSPSSIS